MEILYHFAIAEILILWYSNFSYFYICDIKEIKDTYLFTLIGMSYERKKCSFLAPSKRILFKIQIWSKKDKKVSPLMPIRVKNGIKIQNDFKKVLNPMRTTLDFWQKSSFCSQESKCLFPCLQHTRRWA